MNELIKKIKDSILITNSGCWEWQKRIDGNGYVDKNEIKISIDEIIV